MSEPDSKYGGGGSKNGQQQNNSEKPVNIPLMKQKKVAYLGVLLHNYREQEVIQVSRKKMTRVFNDICQEQNNSLNMQKITENSTMKSSSAVAAPTPLLVKAHSGLSSQASEIEVIQDIALLLNSEDLKWLISGQLKHAAKDMQGNEERARAEISKVRLPFKLLS